MNEVLHEYNIESTQVSLLPLNPPGGTFCKLLICNVSPLTADRQALGGWGVKPLKIVNSTFGNRLNYLSKRKPN